MSVLVLPKSQFSISLDVKSFCGSIFAKASQPFKEIGRKGRNGHETHLQEGPMDLPIYGGGGFRVLSLFLWPTTPLLKPILILHTYIHTYMPMESFNLIMQGFFFFFNFVM